MCAVRHWPSDEPCPAYLLGFIRQEQVVHRQVAQADVHGLGQLATDGGSVQERICFLGIGRVVCRKILDFHVLDELAENAPFPPLAVQRVRGVEVRVRIANDDRCNKDLSRCENRIRPCEEILTLDGLP